MSRIKNPDLLRTKVQKIEAKIREIIDSKGRWSDTPNLKDKVNSLLEDRASYLNRMFLATPEEVTRLESMNEMLLKKVEDMNRRARMLWQTMLTMKQMPEFDDDFHVSAELRVYGDRSDEEAILYLPEDEYYGSDFALANEAIVAVMPECWNHAHCSCTAYPWEVDTIGDNPHDEFTSSMEDGQTWAEGALCHPALAHICICHPIHDIVTHLPFSIPDLLRINTFTTKVTLEISNTTTQSGIRSFEKGYRQWQTEADLDPRSIPYLQKSR